MPEWIAWLGSAIALAYAGWQKFKNDEKRSVREEKTEDERSARELANEKFRDDALVVVINELKGEVSAARADLRREFESHIASVADLTGKVSIQETKISLLEKAHSDCTALTDRQQQQIDLLKAENRDMRNRLGLLESA